MSTQNSKHGSFFVKSIETYPEGRALMNMYIVVSLTKRGNLIFHTKKYCMSMYLNLLTSTIYVQRPCVPVCGRCSQPIF